MKKKEWKGKRKEKNFPCPQRRPRRRRRPANEYIYECGENIFASLFNFYAEQH